MDIDRIRELLQVVADSGVAEVEIHDDDFKLVVRKSAPTVTVQSAPAPYPYPMAPMHAPMAPAPMPAAPAQVAAAPAPAAEAPAAPAAPSGEQVRAPIVGTFYRASSPDADPYVSVGDTVKKGDVLCIIEAMKLMNEIESEVAGTVKEILVENAQPVEFDQPLFIVDPS
ncbi:MAG: acetyl-CoA carboxylase biotin carboxyl carrier protein [Rhodothermales bacterium]|nr:acetyl-CoA carboxylase biotin carboxyl carrier protein [Rhodothermales bacterium]MBO6779043.1 acetyl-CoA carboxylase biotin carboxyl carrier protein [Rhodothermales bacterium]